MELKAEIEVTMVDGQNGAILCEECTENIISNRELAAQVDIILTRAAEQIETVVNKMMYKTEKGHWRFK